MELKFEVMQKAANLNQNPKQNTIPSSGESDSNGYELQKEVILFVVRRSLLEFGIEAFEMFNRSLIEKYRCDISDCIERPNYLLDVLKYVYDSSGMKIIESINERLRDFAEDKKIHEFLEKLR